MSVRGQINSPYKISATGGGVWDHPRPQDPLLNPIGYTPKAKIFLAIREIFWRRAKQ